MTRRHAGGVDGERPSEKDPVCGMTVSAASSHRHHYNGHTYKEFCSASMTS